MKRTIFLLYGVALHLVGARYAIHTYIIAQTPYGVEHCEISKIAKIGSSEDL